MDIMKVYQSMIMTAGELNIMDSKIPDFGRASVDQADKFLQGFFKKKEKEQDKMRLMSLDQVDLTDALAPEPDKKKWTVLFYMDGNNNLFGPMYDAMKGLESVGSNKDVNLVVELGGDPGDKGHGGIMEQIMAQAYKDKKVDTVRRYYVKKDYTEHPEIKSPIIKDLGKQDMGDPKVISEFIDWGIKNFPAEHYAVVFFDHGAGFAGSMSDENTGHLMNTNQLKEVMEKAAQSAGKKIDIVDFDACLMAQIEVAHAIKDSANYMIASEETERGTAQPLTKIMKDLQEGSKDAPMDPKDFARLFVYEAFHQNQGEILTATLSAVDLQKIDGVVNSTDKLSRVLMAGNVDPEVVRNSVKKTEYYCQDLPYKLYNDYHDIGHFAENLLKDPKLTDEGAKKAAAELQSALGEAVIAVEHQGKKYQNSTGLSTYLPTNYGFDPKPKTDSVNFSSTHNYDQIPYAKDSQWDEMVKFIAKDSKWHNFLKAFGLEKEGIDKMDAKLKAIGGSAMGLSKLVLEGAKWEGRLEAKNAIFSHVPKSYLWMGTELSSKLGMLGGGYKVFEGVKGMYNALSSSSAPSGISDIVFTKQNKIVNAGFNVAEGSALIATNTALLLGASAGITTATGLLSFALPAAKIIYDAINVPKNLKAKADEAMQPNPTEGLTVQEKLQDIEDKKGHFEKM
jgi:hypothetical protein